jgi:hypothetical protein
LGSLALLQNSYPEHGKQLLSGNSIYRNAGSKPSTVADQPYTVTLFFVTGRTIPLHLLSAADNRIHQCFRKPTYKI